MQNKTKNCIQQATTTYLLNMSSEENKINTNENKSNIIVEYGEQNLKEILLQIIKQEYINHYNDNKNTSSQKESNIKPMENI